MSDYHPCWLANPSDEKPSGTRVASQLYGAMVEKFEFGEMRRIAVEVKATKNLGDKHFSGLKDLQAALGERFCCGVVLYGGEQRVRFGERLWAVAVGG